jgi:hypothetical protein
MTLREVYLNETVRTDLKNLLVWALGEVAKEQAFNGTPTAGIKDANESIDKVFEKLEEMFEPKELVKKGLNEAR